MIYLSDSQIEQLNALKSVKAFSPALKSPTLSAKIDYALRESTGGVCLRAQEKINMGEVVCFGDGSRIDRPIKYSYQIDHNVHLVGPGGLDHSCCSPNCQIESNSNNFVAIRDIEKGEFLTFNYLTTEYNMNTPFTCICGDEGCFRHIRGFHCLSKQEKDFISSHFTMSDFLKKQYMA